MKQNNIATGRLAELDSLRGYAALVVVLNHFAFVFGPRTVAPGYRYIPRLYEVMELSPLHLLIAGHEAVLLFFLLSGFVLTLPYLRQPAPTYNKFLVKRAFRLYAPYVIALLIACLANAFVMGTTAPDVSDWFRHVWSLPPDRDSIVQHVLLIGRYDYSRYNTAFWSLVYEARISLIFPLIVLLVKKLTWRKSLGIALLLSAAAQGVALVVVDQTYVATVHYIALFIIGSLGAQYHDSLSAWMKRIGKKGHIWLLGSAFCILGTSQLLKHVPGILHKLQLLTDWPAIAGCAVLLISALETRGFKMHLLGVVPQYLGKISYSLYLIHATVLFVMVRFLLWKMPIVFLFLSYISVALVVSSIFHLAIEAPSIRLGRYYGRSTVARSRASMTIR